MRFPLGIALLLLWGGLLGFLVAVRGQKWTFEFSLDPGSSNIGKCLGYGKSLAISPSNNLLVIGSASDSSPTTSFSGVLWMYTKNGDRWLFSVRLSPSTVASAGLGTVVSISDSVVAASAPFENMEAVYTMTLQNSVWVSQSKLIQAGLGGINFGSSIALGTDILAVGANAYATSSGILYLYSQGNGGWDLVHSMRVSSSVLLGSSIALSSEFIASGSKGEDSETGAVYVWSRSAFNFSTTSRLTSNKPVPAHGYFGQSVSALSHTILVVGCLYCNFVSVFSLSSSVWINTGSFSPSTPRSGFGSTISSSYPYVIVGSSTPYIHVVSFSSNSWSDVTEISLPSTGSSSVGEIKVAMSGNSAVVSSFACTFDYASGQSEVLQKAFGYTLLSQSRSRSPAPSRSRSARRRQTRSMSRSFSPSIKSFSITVASSSKSEQVGRSLLFLRDRALISVPSCVDQSSCDGGYVMVYKLVKSKWTLDTSIKNPFNNRDVKFGYMMATNGNILVISAPDASSGSALGSIGTFIWNEKDGGFSKGTNIRNKIGSKSLSYGKSMALFKQILAVGSPGYDTNIYVTNTGCVYIHRYTDNTWDNGYMINSPLTSSSDEYFGSSVSLQSETRVAISNSPKNTQLRAVYIFEYTNNETWDWMQTISDLSKLGFGWKVFFNSKDLYISSPYDSTTAQAAGSITVYRRNSMGAYVASSTIKAQKTTSGEVFGYSFDILENRLVVGAMPCAEGKVCNNKGTVYEFTWANNQWTQIKSHSYGISSGADGYGANVALGSNRLMIAAPSDTTKSSRVGSTYVVWK